jgi:16S rRNA (cytosine967-C5)-methyltransferase
VNAEATPERRVALRVLRRVADGAYADRALHGEAERAGLEPSRRAVAHRLSFGVVQRRRTLDVLLDPAITNPGGVEPEIRDVLRLGAFELAFSDRVPPRAAVDQAVRLARSLPGDERRRTARAGLVNAVLRRVGPGVREALATLPTGTPQELAVAASVPDWIAERLCDALGRETARTVLYAGNEPTESAVRWNPLRGTRQELEARLPADTRRDRVIDEAYVLSQAFDLERSAIWHEGRAMAQSRASMLPALALDPRPGERVLDVCAAPGAKTTHLAALSGGSAEIVAIEARPARARALRALCSRMGARVTVIEGDGTWVPLEGAFDAALLDPPCTGLGVLSARPDARWRRRESEIATLVDLQTRLLARAIAAVRPGGRIVYSTCTLLPEENQGVFGVTGLPITDLTKRFPAFAFPDCPGALRTLPGRDGTDGFVVARLEIPGNR